MSLLLGSSAQSFLFEPNTLDEEFLFSDVLDLLEVDDLEGNCLFADNPQPLAKVSVMSEPTLKKLRPRCFSDDKQQPQPKRVRKTSSAAPRLRNKGKIELLRREINDLQAELESLRDTKRDAERLEGDSAMWEMVASRQRQERERAEAENKALKELLSTQSTLTTSLHSVFDEWGSLPQNV